MAQRPAQFFNFEHCRLAYRIDGPEGATPLVMIQGVGAQGTCPNPLIEILARQYLCLSFDNRGIGESRPRGKPLSAGQMADDALALMRHVGWDSFHIIGHSFGGLVALELALRAKSRVRSLSLLCAFARGSDSVRLSVELLWIILRLQFAPRFMRQRAFLDLVLPPGERKDPQKLLAKLAAILGHDVADIPPIAREQIAAMRSSDVSGRLGELSGIPVLVVNADKDLVAPPELGKAIAKAIGAGARFVEIPHAAHAFPILEPELCTALLLEHLAAVEAAGQAR